MHDTICREGATPRRQARIEIAEKHIKALTGERSVVDATSDGQIYDFVFRGRTPRLGNSAFKKILQRIADAANVFRGFW